MKSRYKIGAAVIGSFVVGVGAASVSHAQARPPAYVWAEIDIKDVVGYNNYFLAQARANIRESGGKYLAGNSDASGPTAVSLKRPTAARSCCSFTVRRYGGGQGVLCETARA